MKALAIVLMLTSLLLAACASAPEPVEQQAVTLKALGEEADVPLFKDVLSLLPEEVAHLPSGTECTLVAIQSQERAHGVETLTMYQVDCDGTVGWVTEESVIFAPGESPSQ